MDDDKINQPENQPENRDSKSENLYQNAPKPIFETVPQEDQNKIREPLRTEETPANLTPEDIESVGAPPPNHETFFSDDKKKYFYIAGGALVFILIFILILRFFFGRGAADKEI